MTTSNLTTTAASYNDYYGLGLYSYRYPQPNIRVLKTIFQTLSPLGETCRILDYGCGYGRYLYPILRRTKHTAYGYDISQTAIDQATLNLQPYETRTKLFNQLNHLTESLQETGKLDVGLLLFGVLAHVEGKAHRLALLTWFHDHLHPEHGRLIISVPNRWRRFLYLQWQHRHRPGNIPGDIEYARIQAGRKITLYYHLYSHAEFKEELAQAGFEVERIKAESIFPERVVIHHPILAWIDNGLCHLLPASAGYGMLAVARKRT